MKTNSFIWIWYFMIAAFIGCMFLSCRAVRDQKAVDRVTASRHLMDEVYPEIAKIHPCIPDTPRIIHGKTITVIDSSFGEENIQKLKTVIDSLLKVHCPTPKGYNEDSLKEAIYQEVRKGCKPELIIKNTVDTVVRKDVRELNIEKEKGQKLQDQLNKKIAENATLQSKLTKARLMFWGLVALIVIAFGLKFYMPKIPKLPKL